MLDTISAPDVGLMASHQANDLREQPSDCDLLLKEAHHRMNNTLTLLIAWLRLDFAPVESIDLPEAIKRFERRILAFGMPPHSLPAKLIFGHMAPISR